MAAATALSSPTGRKDNLAILYQGVFTAIVRVQSGKQPLQDARAFRKRIQDVFAEIDREAVKIGYKVEDVADANYAVIAFLDEAILSCGDPARSQWNSLQAEMFQKSEAGEAVFERLNALRKRGDSRRLADIFEVYYLCFLLGYKGRYALGTSDAELRQIQEALRERIESVRGAVTHLSPEPPPEPVQVDTPRRRKDTSIYGWLAGASAASVFLAWVLFRILLFTQSETAQRAIESASR